MQRLCDKVNIIPVIAKADTMTPEEIQLFKKQILNEIAQHKIKIYDFPDPLEDDEEVKVLKQLRNRVPFAVVGANTVIEVDGKKVRGRRYPWGIAEGGFFFIFYVLLLLAVGKMSLNSSFRGKIEEKICWREP